MRKGQDFDVVTLSNPLQAADLVTMLGLTLPGRRLAVAASYLGIHVNDLFQASGMTPGDRAYYIRQRGDHLGLPSIIMVRLARVLGVPFETLWDDQALDSPVDVLKFTSVMGSTGGKHEKGRPTRDRHDRGLRLAAG